MMKPPREECVNRSDHSENGCYGPCSKTMGLSKHSFPIAFLSQVSFFLLLRILLTDKLLSLTIEVDGFLDVQILSPAFQRFAVRSSRRIDDISNMAAKKKQELAEQVYKNFESFKNQQ
ncbi:hypothetical protein OIU77_017379 [Salix suchowensis]|uniref:Uncharacterized protein n=1 Tax=Salix suchowensis TaxID=1278906 RepID=A0ABQ8ZNV4_9ROSI|nr:hypothetical protein OIU77_017379 [Salix suchowensis]